MKNPWDDEPESVDFEHMGYKCAMRRNSFGAWCGYVAVPDTHALYQKDYSYRLLLSPADDTKIDEVGVLNAFCSAFKEADGKTELTLLIPCHGGLTFAGTGTWLEPTGTVWWFGFDCSHSGDRAPDDRLGSYGIYRDESYVRGVIEKMVPVIDALKKVYE